MLTIGIDRGDQLRKGHAALTGDLLQTVPELVFDADARLVAGNDNRALRNRRTGKKPPGLVPPGISC
jgi:predicted nucleic acid-binding protein